ncbi:SDR family oxidoreductase [Lachnospiraceae bacterium]|nr:SDR family oxidoreductase [Lachnospiraceae bacterium]
MNILVTGALGFIGQNFVENLKTIRDGKNQTRPNIIIDKIYEYDKNNTLEELDIFCSDCDFVFNFAGVNRPKDLEDFNKGNYEFAYILLNTLKKHENKASVMLASSIQATLGGRFGVTEYGLSKKAGEDLFFAYAIETGAKVLVYRFPNVAGKWVRPNYNSVVGTFCYNIANDLPITVSNPSVELEILFIDDLIDELYDALEGKEHHCIYPAMGEKIDGIVYDGVTPLWSDEGKYCGAVTTHKATLGEIAERISTFHAQPNTLIMPRITAGSFEYKLYSMYLSYLPKNKMMFDLKMNTDERGSFTELLKSVDYGQISVNIIKPGITKGQHWHNTKWEYFFVVSGHGLIRERKIGTDEMIEIEVNGEHIQAVHMLPGYTHSITNLSDMENLITVMWANEIFDSNYPDTFFEPV